MSQVLTIYNPTSGNVAYMSRDCRLTVPTGESTHTLPDPAAKRITAFLKSQHPLLKVTAKPADKSESGDAQGEGDAAETASEASAPKAPAKTKTASSRKTKASATNDSEASAE